MEIVLIRHGQPEWARDGLRVGDPPLTPLGFQQADLLAAAHLDLDPSHLAVSPLLRARQTAAPLLGALGRDEHIEGWLEEMRDPDWHGVPEAVASASFAEHDAVSAERRWDGLAGGEPPREFVARVTGGATAWLAGHGVRRAPGTLPVWHIDDPSLRLAVVAHGGTNGVLICHLLGLDPTPWEWQRFVHQHTGVSRFKSFPVGDTHAFALAQLSSVEHLTAHLRTQ